VSAADSLVLGDTVELLLGGAVSAHPRCPGAVMTLQDGFSRGSGAPDTRAVQSLLLDGERVTGLRTANRQVVLPVRITAPGVTESLRRATINGAKELLLDIVNQPQFRLQWTPDPQGGTPLPMILECSRSTEATPVYNQDAADQYNEFVTLTFPAHPFGRSSDFTTLKFPSPAVSWSTPPSPVRLDDSSTVSSSTSPADWSQSAQHVDDSFSARWSAAGASDQPFYTHTLAAPVDITSLDQIRFSFGLGTANYTDWHNGRVTFALTLTDATGGPGHTLSFGNHAWCAAGNDPGYPLWQPVTFQIPASSTFDFAHVASYSIRAWRRVDWLGRLTLDADAYLNGLTATASASAPVAQVRGTVYKIAAPGTARTLMSAQFQPPLPPALVPQTAQFTAAGPWQWIPPIGAVIQKMLVQGASGRGGGRSTAGAAAGAGAGASVTVLNYPCTPGQAITGNIGAAGTSGSFPVLAASYPVYQDGSNFYSLQTPSFTPAAGEVIVVKAMNGYQLGTFGTPTGGGLTYTSRASNTSSNSRVQLWTAVVGGSPTAMTVSLSVSGYPLPHGMVVERWTNAKLAGSPAVVNTNGSGAPSATITTAAANSAVSWANVDDAAGTGARTYRSSAAEVAYHNLSGSWYTGYWAYQTAVAAGSQTVGLTAPSSQTWGLVGVEIQALVTGGLADGQPTSADGVAIIAAGGQSVADNSNTPGLGGTTAACTVPGGGTARRGGNGAAGSTTGGGGGGGADDTAQGGDAAGQTAGAAGGTNAGAGGTGGAAGGNNPGGAGVAPAGAGAGAFSTGGAAAGGAGANGKVTITYTAPLTPFKTLLVHAPGYGAPAAFSPLIPAGAGLDPPDGREYPVPSPIAGLNARFYGTYSVWAMFGATGLNTPSASRTVVVTFKQYDYPGGPSTSVSVTRTLTPTTESPPVLNGVVPIDVVTLPCRDIADDQTAAYTTVSVTSTNAADRLLDIIVVDVTGQLLVINGTTAYPNFWWDMPETDRDWGRVLGSTYDRAQAVSVLDSVTTSGGPPMLDPDGPGWFLVYSPDAGAPSLTAGCWARWRDSRLS
jgi:hypothetical protein